MTLEQREVVAAIAAGDVDADDTAATHALSKVLMTAHVAPASSSSTSATSFFEDETDEEREGKRDTQAGAPPRVPKPGNEDGEATEVIELDQEALQRALRPTVQEGLSDVEGALGAAPRCSLGSNEEMPRKSRMTVLEAGK